MATSDTVCFKGIGNVESITTNEGLTSEQAENEALFRGTDTLVRVFEFAVHHKDRRSKGTQPRNAIRFLGVDEADCFAQYIVHKNIQRELVTKYQFCAAQVSGPFMARFNDETSRYEIDEAATKEILSHKPPVA